MSPNKPEIEIEGVRLTSPDRVLYDEQGITKRGLAEYYRDMAERILPHLEGRPLTLIRCPRGQGEACFVQRRASESFPASIRRVEVPDGKETATYVVVDSLPGLLELVQLGTLELHTWSARRDRLDRPDRLVLDLDPDPALSFREVAAAARAIRHRLGELGLESFVKTSGGKGVHVVAPLVRRAGWEEVRDFARALAEEMERREPERYIAEASRAERAGKIFIDYLRNAWSASVVAAYSTRAKPGAPVSTPLSWDELDQGVEPGAFTAETLAQRMQRLERDPWEGYGRIRQWITRAAREAVRQ
jgi:bifunctional non-homologous end joining protein LigD